MRVAILANDWTGYLDASGRELAARGVELLVVHQEDAAHVDFADRELETYAETSTWRGAPEAGSTVARVGAFRPDAVLMHSWHLAGYRAVMKALPPGTLRVLWMDNVWRATAKQWAGRATARRYVQPLFDAVMVPGERTEFFAQRLGFAPQDVIRGSLCADTRLFATGPRSGEEIASRAEFLAVLRLVHHKGADVLAEAFGRYRSSGGTWGLAVAGLGPMADAFDGIPGARLLGFQQPREVAELMRHSSCLVNPSRIEPYGLVLHEGAVSGLPLITSHAVGAAPTLVSDGQNGLTVAADDPAALAQALHRMSSEPPARLAEMSAVSRALGARIDSPGWARHLHAELESRLAAIRA